MDPLWRHPEFWAAMVFVVLVKYRAQPTIGFLGSALGAVIAVLGAMVFTGAAVDVLGFEGENWTFAVAGLVALTCEHIARMLLDVTPSDLIKWWRGK